MSRVHSNCSLPAHRRLPVIFNSNTEAIGITSPNALNGNLPKKEDAMGIAGNDGIVTLVHAGGAGKSIQLWLWNDEVNKRTTAQGWVGYKATAALSTQSVDGFCVAKFDDVPENALLFFSTTSAGIANGWTSARKYNGNPAVDPGP